MSTGKPANSWIKFRLLYDKSFAPALGGARTMGTKTMALIQTCQIPAIMTVPHRLSFSTQLSNCSVRTCWHSELSILGFIHLSISIHFSNSSLYSCSMKFFLGLALGESCVACATTKKHWCLQRPVSVGRLSCANLELVPLKQTQWHWSKHVKFRPSWLFQKGCLSLHSWQTAMLAHVGTEWHILAHVGIQLSPPFIHYIHWDNSFSGSIKFFHLKIALGLALGESWCATTNNTHVHKGMLLWESFPLANLQQSPSAKTSCKLIDQI